MQLKPACSYETDNIHHRWRRGRWARGRRRVHLSHGPWTVDVLVLHISPNLLHIAPNLAAGAPDLVLELIAIGKSERILCRA